MSKISDADIDERVRTFAESVRNGMHGFQPGKSWWIVRQTSKSRKSFDNPVTLCNQLGISDEDIGNHLNNTRWTGLIGDTVYTNYLRRGQIQDYYLVTVTMENQTNNSSPTDKGSKVVMNDEGFRTTRTSKCPWMMLQDRICGTVDPDLGLRPTKKRKAQDISPESQDISPEFKAIEQPPKETMVESIAAEARNNYFSSMNAILLFKPIESEENVLVAITNQINILKEAQKTSASYKLLLPPHPSKTFSEHDVFIIRQKISILTLALNNAKRFMPQKTWRECCAMALETAEDMGLSVSTWPRTVMKWYHQFKINRLLAIPYVPDKHKLHPFLQHNNDVVIRIKEYARLNIHRLSAELIFAYLHDTIIPELVKERLNPDNKSTEEMTRELLHEYGLSTLSVGTVCRWMNRLGFKYCVRKKSYYVDGHERPGTVTYRKDFVRRYLCYERRAYRWIQISKTEHDELVQKGNEILLYDMLFIIILTEIFR
jgi:hypothetical protein